MVLVIDTLHSSLDEAPPSTPDHLLKGLPSCPPLTWSLSGSPNVEFLSVSAGERGSLVSQVLTTQPPRPEFGCLAHK